MINFGARGEWELPLGSDLVLIAGVDVEGGAFDGAYRGSAAPSQEGSLGTPDNVQDQITVDRTRFLLLSPAAYVEARYFATPRLLVIPGVRLDYYHQLEAFTVNPRLSQRYALTDDLTLKSAVGWTPIAPTSSCSEPA